MTTLIDRIMNKIEIDHTGKWADDMISIKRILKAELTAVKGVDEQSILLLSRIANELEVITPMDIKYNQTKMSLSDYAAEIKKIIKALKQTPVTSEEYNDGDDKSVAYEMGYQDGLKDSNPKEDKEGHICGSIQPESEYCDICGKPMGTV